MILNYYYSTDYVACNNVCIIFNAFDLNFRHSYAAERFKLYLKSLIL